MKKKQTMTKDIVPEDFTLGLAFVDAIPVLFFGLSFILLGTLLSSKLFLLGAAICLLGGAGKVLWKIIVVLKKKNIWWLFVQMRILMPLGFVLMLAAFFLKLPQLNGEVILAAILSFPEIIFFSLGIIGMILMIIFAIVLDSSSLRSNWIEQITNGISQICFFIGILFCRL